MSAQRALPLPPMPLWLRLLGVGVCLTPLVLGVLGVFTLEQPEQRLEEIFFVMILLSTVVLLLLVPMLAPLLCWALGWRPGALVCSGYLGPIGLGFLGDDGLTHLACSSFLLHLPLLGLLAWERRAAIRRRRQLLAALPPPSLSA